MMAVTNSFAIAVKKVAVCVALRGMFWQNRAPSSRWAVFLSFEEPNSLMFSSVVIDLAKKTSSIFFSRGSEYV